MKYMDQKIKIAGAGIAGLTAAINLKLAGYEVVVFEKNGKVGTQHHNDFQGLENWSQTEDALDFLKRINIDTDFYNKPCRQVTVFDSHNHKSVATSEIPFLYLVKRGSDADSLDQYLKRKAEEIGIEIEFGKKVAVEDVDIVATGPVAPPRGVGYGISFKTDLPDCLCAIMDNKLTPYGYAYLIVVDGQGTLAVALVQDFQKIETYFSKALERFRDLFQFQVKEPQKFSGFANANFIRRKEKIYIGEAAGFQDIFWGFGMRYAFLSGHLACQALVNNKDYWLMVRKEIHPGMKSSAVNRLFLYLFGGIGLNWLIRKTGGSANQRKIIQKAYLYPFYKKIFYPFAKIILKI